MAAKKTARRSDRRPARRKAARKTSARRKSLRAAKARRPKPRKPQAKARKMARPRKVARPKKAARKVARRSAPTRPPAKASRRAPAPARRKAVTAVARSPRPKSQSAGPRRPPAPRPPAPRPVLDRARRQLPAEERLDTAAAQDSRVISSARAGRGEMLRNLSSHTETSPELTAGDIDARWDDAYAVGDEAPGGDNPTPDQDRVDDIGKALGVTYQDDEELQGSEKVVERDRHRWELDPASSDDWPHNQD